MKRGDVYVAILKPRSGSEQQGKRPVIVVSHDSFNQTLNWNSVIVIPVSTSTAQAKRGPTAIFLPQGSGGLDKDSIALCHQVTTLDRAKLGVCLGMLPADLLAQVELGLKSALDLR
jgi:mRNA interferase MazF